MGESKRKAAYVDNLRKNATSLEEFQAILRQRYRKPPPIVVMDQESIKQVVSKRKDPEFKEDKGLKNGSCNRRDCQKPGATWYNSGMRAYYCEHCAGMINDGYMGRSLMEQMGKTPLCVNEAVDPPGTEKFVCVRVYANGEAKFTVRDKEGMESWLEYNLENRWGNALFVNGAYRGGGKGYFKEERLKNIATYLMSELADDMRRPIEHLREQPEYCGGINLGTRLRYNDELYYPKPVNHL